MRFTAAALVALLSLAVPSAARAEVRLTMHDGVVSLTARDATVRQILAEWARVGQTRIINAEGIVGGPVSLQLIDVPEGQALDIILRTASGYLAAPRQVAAANLSRFDRILIMPTSVPITTPARPGAPAPAFPQPRLQPSNDTPSPDAVADDDDDDQPLPNAPPPAPPLSQRGAAAAPSTFPLPVAPQAGDDTAPTSTAQYGSPTANVPAGVATPGMIVQPPQPPAAPNAPARQP